ncbi:MAG: PHP domain-containing protein [Thermoleophilia bacterium]|nr:PHP domain-containing protein [Thermoleophilia bacterium]
MSQRICLVTPYAWSLPHEANQHLEGLAEALRVRGHDVVVLTPSGRATELQAGRRALHRGDLSGTVAIAPALPVSTRTAVALPVGLRANVRRALAFGNFDVVHAIDPVAPGLSALALLEAEVATVATFLDPWVPSAPRKRWRDRLLARIDVLTAPDATRAAEASKHFPGHYRFVPEGVTPFPETGKERLVVVETTAAAIPAARATLRALAALPGWEATLLRTVRLAARPAIPAIVRGRVRVATADTPAARRSLLARAAIVVAAPGGSHRLQLEARAAGCALITASAGAAGAEQTAAELLRLVSDPDALAATAATGRGEAEISFADEADRYATLYAEATARPRPPRQRGRDPLAGRDWIVADLHMHTSWSHDCTMDVPEILDRAEAQGLGAIAITDHNVFGGALEAVAAARSRDLVVIPGEEVKTDGQGEVIGLFLQREIPRGMPFADTVAAIREQGGIVYVPHPFDRMHAIPSPATLHRHLAEIDVLEVYNARLLFEGYNDEALRFARKYRLLQGAGSDAHVLQGIGTGAVRMRRFGDPEEFLLSLRTAEVLRRPKSLAFLQARKWVAQVKEKVR